MMKWQSKPTEHDERYCGVVVGDGGFYKTGAYEVWRRGGELWLRNKVQDLWIRLPESVFGSEIAEESLSDGK